MMDDLKDRLRLASESASRIQRQMAESKSLRQESNVERRTDLYMWPEPAQTLEGRALERIEKLEAENARLVDAANAVIENKFATYKARNGKHMSIEADDGEKCWIVHSDDIFSLEQALGETQ